MNLQNIETIVLKNIKYDSYASLSADTDTAKMEDFSILHSCIYLAREEIKLNCLIPALLKHATQIATVAGTKAYTISDTDFDLPIALRYTTSDSQIQLTRRTYENILEVVEKTTTQGTPTYYIPFGSTSAGLSKIELFPIPEKSNEYLDIDYKPTFSVLTTNTDEDLIMLKYPLTVIKLASAYAFQLLRQDKENFATWINLGRIDFKEINLREVGFDYKPDIMTDEFIRSKRNDRYTR